MKVLTILCVVSPIIRFSNSHGMLCLFFLFSLFGLYIFVALNLPSIILYVEYSECFRSFITIADSMKNDGKKWKKYGECAKRNGETCSSDYELNCSLQIHFGARKKFSFDCIVLVFLPFALSRSWIHTSKSEKKTRSIRDLPWIYSPVVPVNLWELRTLPHLFAFIITDFLCSFFYSWKKYDQSMLSPKKNSIYRATRKDRH